MGGPNCILLNQHRVVITVDLVPVPTREVGHSHRSAVVFERHGRQRPDARPFGGIINVLIERQAVVQTVDQAVIHDEIHAAVAADLPGLRLDLHSNRMFVTLHQRLPHLPGHEAVAAQVLVVGHARLRELFGIEGVALNRVFVGEAFRTGQLVHAAVRTRRVDVVFQQDRAALFGLDQRRGVVGVGELRGAHLLPGLFQAVDRPGVHGHEVVHLVAAVDVQQLTGGAEAVRGVNVAAVLLVEVEAPVALVVVPEGIQMLNLINEEFKSVIINMMKQLK